MNPLSATAAMCCKSVISVLCTIGFRREKLRNRETDSAERFARILSVASAFFFGNAETVGGNQQLDIAFQLNDGEHTKCYAHGSGIAALYTVTAETSAYTVRNAADVRDVVATITRIAKSCIQANRFCNLYFCTWICLTGRKYAVCLIIDIFRCEHLYTSVAAVKNAFLCK